MSTLTIDTMKAMNQSAKSPQTNSPLGLRRETSAYSNCSTGTPVLFYTKVATPLNGARWADEFSADSAVAEKKRAAAAASVAASHLPMDALTFEATAAEPAHAEDDAASNGHSDVGGMDERAPSDADTVAYPDTPVKGLTLDADAVAIDVAAVDANSAHVVFAYRFDPYTTGSARREVYRCTCDSCIEACFSSAQQETAPNPYAPVEATEQPFASAEFYGQHATSTPPPQQTPPSGYISEEEYSAGMPVGVSSDVIFNTAATQGNPQFDDAYAQAETVPTAPSVFVPPPPPPRISKRVLAEGFLADGEVSSARNPEAKSAAESIFYHVVMRWFGKVEAVQRNFVPESELCPAPDADRFSFDEWVDAVGRWWLRHFENAQKKPATAPTPVSQPVAPQAQHGSRAPRTTHAGARLHVRTPPPQQVPANADKQPQQPVSMRRGGAGFATHTSPSNALRAPARRDAW